MDLSTLRHSAAHILAQAVKRLYPNVKLGIGPAIEDGFYYDFYLDRAFTLEDLKKIEKEMKKIIKQAYKFERIETTREQAEKILTEAGEDFKLELLKDIPEAETISFYKDGEFLDLCRGPHVEDTSQVKAVKLLSVAGAYWRGDENRPMMQRIYGTAFPTEQQLKDYLRLLEEAKRRDHRKLGKELELFDFYEEIGPGLVVWHPKGALLRSILEDYLKKEHLRRGYQLVVIPHIMKADIWKISGHYDYYRENMFMFEIEGKEYGIKPMNCPGHIMVYKSKLRSYRELPIRLFELGTVYRYERSGVLHGLLRVRGFTQDDAHIFCTQQQLEDEIGGVIDFIKDVLSVFGFSEFELAISTRPDEFIGSEENWQKATTALKSALESRNMKYKINPGEGAFYGPKIDVKLKDALGRQWQCATIQCDFSLPERFDLEYIDKNGTAKRPIMIHRVVLGSIERFIGTLIEHYVGAFPFWLAPEQVRILPVSEKFLDYAKKLEDFLQVNGIRVKVDDSSDTLPKKIRIAEKQKIPYMLIVGEKELESKTVSLRQRGKKDLGEFNWEKLLMMFNKELAKNKEVSHF